MWCFLGGNQTAKNLISCLNLATWRQLNSALNQVCWVKLPLGLCRIMAEHDWFLVRVQKAMHFFIPLVLRAPLKPPQKNGLHSQEGTCTLTNRIQALLRKPQFIRLNSGLIIISLLPYLFQILFSKQQNGGWEQEGWARKGMSKEENEQERNASNHGE